MSLTALLGIHNEQGQKAYARYLKASNYEVNFAKNLADMTKLVKEKEYDLYLMDLNYGFPGSLDISPCIQIYTIVQERIESNKATFLGVSGNDDTVKKGLEYGIPSQMNNQSLSEIIKKLQ